VKFYSENLRAVYLTIRMSEGKKESASAVEVGNVTIQAMYV
jgi:hypothetical protein